MGIHYDAAIVWGLHIPASDELYGTDLTDVYELPIGFSYSSGGNHIDGQPDYVVHPAGASRVVLDTLSEQGFGVHAVNDVYIPSVDDGLVLREFAQDNGLKLRMGWFAVSSVG